MQKTTKNGTTVLTADEGLVLTNGQAYGSTVWLAPSDSPDNWREITEAEAERMMAEADADPELTAVEALEILLGGSE